MSSPSTQATQVCSRHGDRETLLTCGRCGQPYCTDCLIHTPAGQRCHQCAGVSRHAAEQAAWTAVWQTVAITAAASAGHAHLQRVAVHPAARGRRRLRGRNPLGTAGQPPHAQPHPGDHGPELPWRDHPRAAHLCTGAGCSCRAPSPPALPSLLRSATPCCCSSPPWPPASPGGVCGSLDQSLATENGQRRVGHTSPPGPLSTMRRGGVYRP